jgi:ribosomal protein S18 acetylase RimI-like enzyme
VSGRVRRVEVDDLAGVQSLLRASFEPWLQRYLIPAQSGYPEFARIHVENSCVIADAPELLLAETAAGDLLGYAEFRRRSEERAILTYICVAARARGTGVASRLVETYLAEAPTIERLETNVFETNAAARAFYLQRGFCVTGDIVWWSKDVSARGGLAAAPLRLEDLPAAIAAFDRFGFCEVSGSIEDRPVKLGRIGRTVLRCYREEDFLSERLLSAAVSVFPDVREALLVLPGDRPVHDPEAQPVLRSLRMEWVRPGRSPASA